MWAWAWARVKLVSSSESRMARPFRPALPQRKKQCWHNRGPKSHRPAGLGQVMRPRWRLAMGNAWRVSKAALAFQHEPRMHQEAPGSLRRPQEASGGPRRLQEAQGSPRKPQEAPGGPRKPQEASGGPRKPREVPGGSRKPKEVSGSPKESQEAPGGSTRPWGGPRMFQETLGGSRGPRALDERAGEKCAPRCSGSATFRKHARGAEARATFRPVARDVHRVPFLPRTSQRRRQDRPCREENLRLCICGLQSGWEGPA